MRLSFDVEADGLLNDMTKIHCIEVEDVDTGEEYSFGPDNIMEGLHLLAQADWLIGHNILAYDLYAIQEILPTWTPKPGCILYDTFIGSQLGWPDMKRADKEAISRHRKHGKEYDFPNALIGRHSLKAWGFRLGLLKGSFNETEGAFDHWTPELQVYCKNDNKLTVKLFWLQQGKPISKQAMTNELKFAQIIAKQQIHGFYFDLQAAEKLVAELRAECYSLRQELREVFPDRYVSTGSFTPKRTNYQTISVRDGDGNIVGKTKVLYGEGCTFTKLALQSFNPNSDQQIIDRLTKEFHWVPIEFTESGNPSVTDEVLSDLPWPEVKPLAKYKLCQKRISQISDGDFGWIRRTVNGRIHGSMLTNGTVTGRCSHYAPNLAQVPACHHPYGPECRAMFLADPGWVMVGVDADGLELRMLGHYLAKYDGGAFLKAVLEGDKKNQTDVHSRNLAAMKKAGPWFDNMPFDEARDVAKRFMYALIYGGGNKKLGLIVGGTAKDGARLREAFMSGITGFKELCASIEQRLEETGGWITGLDGRRLYARSAHSALNLLLQSAGALIVKLATILAHDKLNNKWPWEGPPKVLYKPLHWAQVNHVHDEIQYVCRPEIAEELKSIVIESLKEAGEIFNMRVPIAGTGKIGKTWADTH